MAKKPVQNTIPGTTPPRHKASEKAASAYVAARDERMDLTKTEVAKREALIAAMRQAGQTTYRMTNGDDVYLVKLTEDTSVKVRKETPPDVEEVEVVGDDGAADGPGEPSGKGRPEPEW